MVVRRWADDGKLEVVPELDDRVYEVAELLGLPVLTRSRGEDVASTRPWVGEPGRLLATVPGAGGPVLVARVGRGEVPAGGRAVADGRAAARPGLAVPRLHVQHVRRGR